MNKLANDLLMELAATQFETYFQNLTDKGRASLLKVIMQISIKYPDITLQEAVEEASNDPDLAAIATSLKNHVSGFGCYINEPVRRRELVQTIIQDPACLELATGWLKTKLNRS